MPHLQRPFVLDVWVLGEAAVFWLWTRGAAAHVRFLVGLAFLRYLSSFRETSSAMFVYKADIQYEVRTQDKNRNMTVDRTPSRRARGVLRCS